MNREARPTERVQDAFSPFEQLEAARAQGSPVQNWRLPALLVALVQLFTPRDHSLGYEPEFAELRRALEAKDIDVEQMVRGPVLRNAAAVTIAHHASRKVRGRSGLDSPEWASLGNWLDAAQQKMPRQAARRSLWAYWATVPLEELLKHPAPPEMYTGAQPAVEPTVQWIFDRCTESELRRWNTSSLEFERGVALLDPDAMDSLRAIVSIRSVNAADVARELYHRQTQGLGPDVDMTLSSRLADVLQVARQAFMAADYDQATRLFRVATELDPDSAVAENNLGFLLLSQGDAQRAIDHFERAERLTFEDPMFLTMNFGCAKYLLGDYAAASEYFAQTLKLPAPSGGWLLQIRDNELELLDLAAPADYIGLGALNGGWNALRQGDIRLAMRLQSVASVGLISFSDEERTKFDRSLTALAFEIRARAGEEMALFEASLGGTIVSSS
ncbi:MAG TPA: hypothetical protein VNF75_06845 [Candidatus Dormibacteraeota bacterium]|nr:hypothetical protein [Candidatus Dormibacteraeota bacterium]